MRDSSQYKELAEWLHDKSTIFFNSFKWVQDLKPEQKAVHKVSQQINVDCHNGFLSSIFQKMAKAEPFRLQHKSYHKVCYDVNKDRDNKKDTRDIPEGIILRRLSSFEPGDYRDSHRPIGKLSNEVRGTLFFKCNSPTMTNICRGSVNNYDFYHPWYWEVPTVDQILKVFQFAEQKYLDHLMELFRTESSR